MRAAQVCHGSVQLQRFNDEVFRIHLPWRAA